MKSTDQVIEYWLLKFRKRQLRHAGILKQKFQVLPQVCWSLHIYSWIACCSNASILNKMKLTSDRNIDWKTCINSGDEYTPFCSLAWSFLPAFSCLIFLYKHATVYSFFLSSLNRSWIQLPETPQSSLALRRHLLNKCWSNLWGKRSVTLHYRPLL